MSSLDHQHLVHRLNRHESVEYSHKWETQAAPLFYMGCYVALAIILFQMSNCGGY